jgi:uncharacterized protein YeaO (DUF488 family)
MKLTIQTKRVYDRPERRDGHRVLVMRLWPRGVRMDSVNLWLKGLGPRRDLLTAYKAGRVRWSTFEKRYLEGLESDEARRALSQLMQTVDGRRFTLLCGCKDLRRCHSALLKRYLARWAGAA